VDSDAATQLTISTFGILKADPNLGPAEALRRVMLAYMNDSSRPQNAHPACCAPFSILGEVPRAEPCGRARCQRLLL
jgi:hypothetical protein